MNKLIACLCSCGLIAQAGCLTLTPVGPFANQMVSKPTAAKPSPGVTVKAAEDAPAGPILMAPPPPPMPTLLVTPGEVTSANAADTMNRLIRELEADRAALDAMPVTAEVSVVGRR